MSQKSQHVTKLKCDFCHILSQNFSKCHRISGKHVLSQGIHSLGWLIVWVGVVLWRTVVGCDPGESMFVVGWSFGLMLSWKGLLLVVTQASQCLWLADRLGCYPVKDCCWLWHRRVNVCGWLIVWVDVILRTVVGSDTGESMFVVG